MDVKSFLMDVCIPLKFAKGYYIVLRFFKLPAACTARRYDKNGSIFTHGLDTSLKLLGTSKETYRKPGNNQEFQGLHFLHSIFCHIS